MKSNFRELFERLSKPKSELSLIPVEALRARPLVLLGRSSAGKPLFLFETELESVAPSNVKLENIEVRYSQDILLALPGKRHKKGCFSVIEYTGLDSNLQHSFLQVIGAHIGTLKDSRSVTVARIAALVQGLVDLFKAEESIQTRNSLQGLWAELF